MSHLHVVGNGHASGGRDMGTLSPRPASADDLWPAQRMLLDALQDALQQNRRTDAARLHAAILVLDGQEGTERFERALHRIHHASGQTGKLSPVPCQGNTVPLDPSNGSREQCSLAGARGRSPRQQQEDASHA